SEPAAFSNVAFSMAPTIPRRRAVDSPGTRPPRLGYPPQSGALAPARGGAVAAAGSTVSTSRRLRRMARTTATKTAARIRAATASFETGMAEGTAAMIAAAGMVRIQAQTMRPATPQRTADRRRVAPTPTIAPVMVWVVETGMPRKVARYREQAAAVSAEKPPTGLRAVIRWPRVLTIRQPPDRVPSAIAEEAG